MRLILSIFSAFLLILGFNNSLQADASQGKERTLVIVKPDAVATNRVGDIIARFEKGGLKLSGLKIVQLNKEDAERFYSVHQGKPFFNDLVEYMTSGPSVTLVFEGPNAVAKAREIIGATDPKKAAPGTVRADFGTSVSANAVHGSDSPENAKQEIQFFFDSQDLIDR